MAEASTSAGASGSHSANIDMLAETIREIRASSIDDKRNKLLRRIESEFTDILIDITYY